LLCLLTACSVRLEKSDDGSVRVQERYTTSSYSPGIMRGGRGSSYAFSREVDRKVALQVSQMMFIAAWF